MSVGPAIPLCVMDHHDPELFEELIARVRGVAASGTFTGGAAVEEFESAYAAWCGAAHAVGVSSGTEALVLALRALSIGPGDEVIVPANSFIATAEAVSLVGARPRFADVDPQTQLVTAETVATALSPAVRCVIPVHLFGRTVELAAISELAREHELHLVEDAAQAHGARYHGRRVGTIGEAGAFSFYPAKNLGAWGDAGAVVSSRGEIADRIRLLRSHGERPRYHHRAVGTTARLDAIQATILRHKLLRLDAWNEARRAVASKLRRGLTDVEGVITPPPPPQDGDHVYHQFVVRSANRDALKALLAERGVASSIHYPVPIHHSPAFAELADERDVAPRATKLAKEILSLPIFPGMTERQIERVTAAVRDASSRIRPPLAAACP